METPIVKKNEDVLVKIKSQYIYQESDDGETPDKKPRLEVAPSESVEVKEEVKQETGEERERQHNRRDHRGNKSRWVDRPSVHNQLCRILVDVPEDGPMPVCSTLRCRFIHDLSKYLEAKAPVISSRCYVYSLKGHCPWGTTCLFSNNHLTDCGRNRVDKEVKEQFDLNGDKTLNFFTTDLERDLRKRKYEFKRSEEVLNILPKPPLPVWHKPQGDVDFTEDVDITDGMDEPPLPYFERERDERIGPCPDDDLFKLHLSEKKKIDWRDKLVLPPLANFGNLPFRRICKEYGADVTCSEPLVASSLLDGAKFDWLLARRHDVEDSFGIQLFGTNPFILTRCAQLVDEKTNADFINLHFGNPGDNMRHMMRKGGPKRAQAMESVVRCMTRVAHLPLTVSARLIDVVDVVSCFKQCQVSMVSLICRDKETRQMDWETLSNTGNELSPVPVMVNSDTFSYHEYAETRAAHPVFANEIMARGALVKPWLFEEVKMKRDRDISSGERFEIIKRFVNYGLENWGSDAKGVEVTRRFLLDWLSFLCRYIPIGLLEKPPQRLTDKCVKYVGRNDMETLLGSQEQKDWIKISEMLLGPTPEGFHFQPKVKYWPVDS